MLRVLVTQLLPLLLALLGAVIGVLLSLLLGLPGQSSTRMWCITIALLLGLVVAGIAYLVCDEISLDRKVQRLTVRIRGEIDAASTIEYNMRGDTNADANLQRYVGQIEQWRDRVIALLQRELPNSGADIRFLTGTGEVGRGPTVYEYTRLTLLRSNLGAVLDNLHSYAQRSRS